MELALAERSGECRWKLGLSVHQFGIRIRQSGAHFLPQCDCCGPPPFCSGLGNSYVGFGLLDLKFRTDILPNFDVGNVDRDNRESRLGVQV
jgi:hypothetical protein